MAKDTHTPRWAQQLMDKHGISEPPKAGEIPSWLKQEVEQKPLWYIIREADGVRSSHPFILIDEIYREPDQLQEILESYGDQAKRLAKELHDRGIEEVIFTGCGSAFFTAMHGEYVFERLTGLRSRAIESFELTYYFP